MKTIDEILKEPIKIPVFLSKEDLKIILEGLDYLGTVNEISIYKELRDLWDRWNTEWFK